MTAYEIYWNDLNREAKKRLKPLWHGNLDTQPLTVIESELCDCSCHDEIEYCENCCEEHEKLSGHSKDATTCSHPECNTRTEKMEEKK